jgi:dTDP-4-dehydrorhamnose 3,5-epimerase
MLPGIAIKPLKRLYDERGSFVEVMRQDWQDVFSEEIVQANMSVSYPGMVRAWHKHERGQVDCFLVVKGALKICAYDDESEEIDEIVCNGESPKVIKMPGDYWHGFRVVGNETATLMYFVNRLYDYKKPDEVRRPWDDKTIIPGCINGKENDPRCGLPWNWFFPPHK